jgi:quinol monooxygenase YgiN
MRAVHAQTLVLKRVLIPFDEWIFIGPPRGQMVTVIRQYCGVLLFHLQSSYDEKLHVLGWSMAGKGVRMLIVHVFVHVTPESVEAFKTATIENARHSVQEAGIARFDVFQQHDDPTRFVLVEVYRTAADPARHKATTHYATWRDTVAAMMAEPRRSITYTNIFPEDTGWELVP